MSQLYMMIGTACSGKSTYVKRNFGHALDEIVLSTDDLVEEIAKLGFSTYNECWSWAIKPAGTLLEMRLKHAIKKNMLIVWDQTNLTVSSRAKKLAKIPRDWEKQAIFVEPPPIEILLGRNEERAVFGKRLNPDIIRKMLDDIQEPTLSEGFDYIEKVKYVAL